MNGIACIVTIDDVFLYTIYVNDTHIAYWSQWNNPSALAFGRFENVATSRTAYTCYQASLLDRLEICIVAPNMRSYAKCYLRAVQYITFHEHVSAGRASEG